MDASALAKIEEGIRTEAGDGWAKDPAILHGRNATRVEHGLPLLDKNPSPARDAPPKRPLWRRLLGG